jgi:hypothetical protein
MKNAKPTSSGVISAMISRKASTPTEFLEQARDSGRVSFMAWPKPPYKSVAKFAALRHPHILPASRVHTEKKTGQATKNGAGTSHCCHGRPGDHLKEFLNNDR